MVPMCWKRAETRRIYGQRNDQGKQAPVCLEMRTNAWEQHGKLSRARIMDDSFGHIECLEMGVVMIASREFLDDVGVFLDYRRNGCQREVYMFVCGWCACKGKVDMMVIATCDEGARLASRPGRHTGDDIVNDCAPILFSEQRCARPQAFFDSNCMNGHELELSLQPRANIAALSTAAIEMFHER
jgi:hypothetical protein